MIRGEANLLPLQRSASLHSPLARRTLHISDITMQVSEKFSKMSLSGMGLVC
ncbi:hypothetical protein [Nitrosomonas sp. Nm33]|uniref:hypothetical protein n=1 Tax=Nitrosomonas sp. Nm33 TaxID=133724 RepID=UPI001C409037|nr:hypothetical protein [Nitrosomonas sp. Nm33]